MFGVGPAEMVIFLIILVVVIFLATRLLQGPGGTGTGGSGDSPTALEVLDQRYARGEINREEYLAIRDDITRAEDDRE